MANTAGTSGGAIEVRDSGAITSSTFTDNTAVAGVGGAIDVAAYSVSIEDTILAGDAAPTGPEVCNAVQSFGHNLVAETDDSSGWVGSDLTGTESTPLDARLSAVGDYGGPTQTVGACRVVPPSAPALRSVA